jgi:hypothetical protein
LHKLLFCLWCILGSFPVDVTLLSSRFSFASRPFFEPNLELLLFGEKARLSLDKVISKLQEEIFTACGPTLGEERGKHYSKQQSTRRQHYLHSVTSRDNVTVTYDDTITARVASRSDVFQQSGYSSGVVPHLLLQIHFVVGANSAHGWLRTTMARRHQTKGRPAVSWHFLVNARRSFSVDAKHACYFKLPLPGSHT